MEGVGLTGSEVGEVGGCTGHYQLVWDIFVSFPSLALRHENKPHVHTLIWDISLREAPQA